MNFRIADTFTDSLNRLTNDEQKAAKTTALDLQMDPSNPGMSFHKLDRAKDPNFWSVRVSGDIRLIVHKTKASLLLCYVDHHDRAYKWAERRKLQTHPKTGAAQLVEVRETVEEIVIPTYVEVEQPKPPLFAGRSDDDLLRYGVPEDWLETVREATENTILDLVDHLPQEAAEALLDLATGVTPTVAEPVVEGDGPFAHPDAQRRFRVMTNVEELQRALEYPWEKWTVFLHPAQQEMVDKDFSGPARVSGSAGTGKTIVALHRAVSLAKRHPEARVLLTTFSDVLANALRRKLHRLAHNEPRLLERLDVRSMEELGRRLYTITVGEPTLAPSKTIRAIIAEITEGMELDVRFTPRFLWTEWEQVVDAWQLDTWDAYRDVPRLGRKTRLPESKRAVLWDIYRQVREALAAHEMITLSQLYAELAAHYAASDHLPYRYIVVDEAQDVSVAQLRFLAAVGSDQENGLFFAGDLGQRIFQQPFSWKSLGVNIQGRSRTLKINYRTSHQIRMQADRLLEPEMADVDGNVEERRGTVSVFNGPPPTVALADDEDHEVEIVAEWIKARVDEGIAPHEVGVFVRSDRELLRAIQAVEQSDLKHNVLDERTDPVRDQVAISTMHLAKGLEFRAVAVMACDEEVIPLQERIETVTDEADLEETYNTERHLLYVACTRARDQLLVTGVDPGSEFLEDLLFAKI